MSDHHPKDPEAVLLAALAARDRWDYDGVVRLSDPTSVDERFASYCEMTRPKTLDDVRGYHPDFPEDRLQEAFERWNASMGDQERWIADAVPGVSGHAQLLTLTPAEFLSRWMAAADLRASLVTQLRARGHTVPEIFLDTPPGFSYVTLGVVHEPPDLVHVLYRTLFESEGGETQRRAVELETLRRQPDGAWRLVASRFSFLRPSGGTAIVLDEEYYRLLTDGPPGTPGGDP